MPVVDILRGTGISVWVDEAKIDAATLWSEEIAELLIKEGADVNAIIFYGRNQEKTPLDLAIQHKKTETADLLRKHGGKRVKN